MTRRTRVATLGAIVALGFWLRTQAIGYGLPAIYNMDEVAIMNRALTFGTGTLNPGNFLYPTFYFYALFAWEGLTALVGLALGWWESLTGFERQFFLDPTPLYLSGRLLSALCGTATIVVVYHIGARVQGVAAGLFSAALIAVAPFAVQDAHYVKHDVPVTLLITAVLLALTSASPRRHLWAAAWAGLALSTHYYAVFATLLIAIDRLSDDAPWRDRLRDLAMAAGLTVVVFLAASPFLLPEWRTAWSDITQNRAIVMDRATAAGGAFGSLPTYLGWLVSGHALGTALTAWLALAGLLAFHQRWSRALLLAVFPVTFLLFIANTFPATRYLNPVLPFLALLTGALLGWGLQLSRVGAVGVALVLVIAGARESVQLGRFFRQDDTRTLAQRWLEAEVPAGATVLVQPYSVPLRQSKEGLAEALRVRLGDEALASVRFQRQLALSPYPAPAYRLIYLGDGGLDADKIYVSPSAVSDASGLAPLRALGVQWVAMKRYNEPNPSLTSFDRALAREGRLVMTFAPFHDEAADAARASVAPFEHNEDAVRHPALARPGPVIELWRIN